MAERGTSDNGRLIGRRWQPVPPARRWWEQHSYKVVRALVLLLIAGLAATAYVSSHNAGRAASLRRQSEPGAIAAPVRGAGVRLASIDPYEDLVYVVNFEQQAVDLTGWRVVAGQRERAPVYYFPPSITIAPGGVIRIHTHRGTDSEVDLYWEVAEDTDLWPWRSGVGILYDAEGREISRFSYAHGASSAVMPTPAATPTVSSVP